MLVFITPTANNLMVLVELSAGSRVKQDMAQLIAWQYAFAPVLLSLSVAAVVLAIGIFFVFQAFTIDTSREAVGPRTMPLIIAVALVISGLWLAVRAYTGKAGDLKEGYGFLESDITRIFLIVACGALFVVLFWALMNYGLSVFIEPLPVFLRG